MAKRNNHTLLTFYKFVDITNPEQQVKTHFQFCHDIGMKGRIYIGEEGISATCTCNPGQLHAYKLFLNHNPYFQNIPDIDIKSSKVSEHAFKKMIVKYRPEIVALGKQYNAKQIEKGGQRMTPDQFKHILDKDDEDYVIIDMRNTYEYKLGHFKNAIPAGTVNFRELDKVIAKYKKAFPDKKIITYCTGGIRCEKATVMLREAGLDDVYQLDGGVVKYVNQYNDGNRLGNLYTFDELVSTRVGDHTTHTKIGKCIYTGYKTDHIENCRYGPCNARIICTKKAYKSHVGFCSQDCFDRAKETLLIKNDKRDQIDYKQLRGAIKANKKNKHKAIQEISVHLNDMLGDTKFNHTTSQKEELIDEHILEEYIA